MSENHATPRPSGQPTPKPLCAIFAPMLPLLRSDGLTAEERASLEEHLADCAWCQNQLATLDVVDAALRRHYASVPAATVGSGSRARVRPALSLEDIMKADQQNKTATAAPTQQRTPRPRELSPRQRTLTALGAIAAVLVLAVLAASLFNYFGARGTGPAAKPTPTRGLDAQSQAYVTVLETYYQPVGQDYDKEESCLEGEGLTSSQSAKFSDMQACQALESTVIQDVHSFDGHLTLPPPARWQTADAQFKQANQAMLATFDASVKATTVAEWEPLNLAEQPAKQLYCAPVNQINHELLVSGYPLSSQLPLPIHAAACPSS